jgi:ADP-ribose pyrophosphatase YjhB (NUDIX family)
MDQPHESPEEVAKRELLEETGWKANRAQLVTSCHTDTGRIDNQIHIIFCDQLEAPSQEWKAEKGIHAALKSAHETQKCILNGTISNLMHRGAWLLCREAGHIKL